MATAYSSVLYKKSGEVFLALVSNTRYNKFFLVVFESLCLLSCISDVRPAIFRY